MFGALFTAHLKNEDNYYQAPGSFQGFSVAVHAEGCAKCPVIGKHPANLSFRDNVCPSPHQSAVLHGGPRRETRRAVFARDHVTDM